MRTSVKKTSLKACSPVISTRARTSIPGARIGQTKYEMPACFAAAGSVRASRMPQWAMWA